MKTVLQGLALIAIVAVAVGFASLMNVPMVYVTSDSMMPDKDGRMTDPNVVAVFEKDGMPASKERWETILSSRYDTVFVSPEWTPGDKTR